MIVLDTETTGTQEKDRIIQFSFAYVDVLKENNFPENVIIKNLYSEYINPGDIKIDYYAMAVHHITPEMLKYRETFGKSRIKKDFLSFENPILIGHNIKFDLDMLKKEGIDTDKYKVIDTLVCSKYIVPDLESYKLEYLRYALELYKYEPKNLTAHNAESDVVITVTLFAYLLKKYDNDVNRLLEEYNKPHLLKTCPFKKYKGIPWEDVVRRDEGFVVWLLNNLTLDRDTEYTIKYYLDKVSKENLNMF